MAVKEDKVPFVILSPPGTASDVLLKALREHPDIRIRPGMPVRPEGAGSQDPADVLKRYFRRGAERAVGLHLRYGQVFGPQNRPILDQLAADKSTRLIHVVRRNPVARYVAAEAKRQQRSATGRQKRSSMTLAVDPEAFGAGLKAISTREERVRRKFKGHDLLEIAHEELSSDPAGTLDEIQRFLAVQAQDLPIQEPETEPPISEVVTNLPELQERFSDTPYARFLAEA
jgi:hypothetical protein